MSLEVFCRDLRFSYLFTHICKYVIAFELFIIQNVLTCSVTVGHFYKTTSFFSSDLRSRRFEIHFKFERQKCLAFFILFGMRKKKKSLFNLEKMSIVLLGFFLLVLSHRLSIFLNWKLQNFMLISIITLRINNN